MPRIARSKAPLAVVYLVAGFLLLATALTSNAAAQSAVASPEAFPDCLGVDLRGAIDQGCGCNLGAPGVCGCDRSVTDVGCGCGKPGPNECGCDPNIIDQGCGCGKGLSCFGCTTPSGGKSIDLGCGCGLPGPGPCGCSPCSNLEANCRGGPLNINGVKHASNLFGTGFDDSHGVLADIPEYLEICTRALQATSWEYVMPYEVETATFQSTAGAVICSFRANSWTIKQCLGARGACNPPHIKALKCRCKTTDELAQ
jgi:hypothetical protein